jgi:hypothetical protein
MFPEPWSLDVGDGPAGAGASAAYEFCPNKAHATAVPIKVDLAILM